MKKSLYFKIKKSSDNDRIVDLFFRSWIDSICNNQVRYTVQRDVTNGWDYGMVSYRETFRVDFENHEDATVIKLAGIPYHFQKYLELVN